MRIPTLRLRPRGSSEVRGAAWTAVLLTGALGYAASLSALLSGPGGGVPRELAAAALALAPFAIGPAALPGRVGARLRRWLALIVAAIQALLAVEAWSLADGSALAAGLCAAQGHALSRAGQSGAAALSLALALAQGSSALRVAPSDAGLVLLVCQLALALVALALMHTLRARRLAARSRRVAEALADQRADVAARLRYGLRLGAGLALPALGLLALGARLGNGTWLARGPEHGPRDQRTDERAPERPDSASRDAAPGLWRDSLTYGEGVGRLSDEAVLWARPLRARDGAPLRDLRALWLRVLALDTFDQAGLRNPRLADVRLVTDDRDGDRDGWLELGPLEGEPCELEVLQRPLRVAASVGDVLVSLQPLAALEAARALVDPHGVVVLPEPHQDWFRYRQIGALPGSLPPPPPGARAAHPDPRFTQLPPPSLELERIATAARRIVGAARDDRGRVERLLDHFEREFDYSLEGSGFAGLSGVLAFLEAREGYCTSFAAAAVLMLRTQGLACRAAGGYLAHEWDDANGAFVVRGRHAHAWIEVHYEGLGWRTYDPTPARPRERAFERALRSEPPEVGEWSRSLAAALRDAVLDDGPAGALERVGSALALAPDVIGASIGRRPLAWVAVLAAALLFVAAASRRKVGGALARAGLRLPGAPPPVSAYERLLALLAGRGMVPRPAETLREFARRVVGELGGVLTGFEGATEVFYRARFGGLEPGREERARLEALLTSAREQLAQRHGAAIVPDP